MGETTVFSGGGWSAAERLPQEVTARAVGSQINAEIGEKRKIKLLIFFPFFKSKQRSFLLLLQGICS